MVVAAPQTYQCLGPAAWGGLFDCFDRQDKPSGLWVSGKARLLGESIARIAIVGARRPTPYGLKIAEELAWRSAQHGVTVVSGLAYGIDTAAHRAALRAKGSTLAVLGTGIDVAYPRENERLQKMEIPSQGLVVSEFAPGTPSFRPNFPHRNRLIAALSLAVVVVEGDVDSGALITARWAARLGKEVFAVPGSIFSAMSRGPNSLIKEGAAPLTKIEDLFDQVPALSRFSRKRGQAAFPRKSSLSPFLGPRPTPGYSRDSSCFKILEKLSLDPVLFDALVELTGLEVEALNQALLELEIQGLVRSGPYGYARN